MDRFHTQAITWKIITSQQKRFWSISKLIVLIGLPTGTKTALSPRSTSVSSAKNKAVFARGSEGYFRNHRLVRGEWRDNVLYALLSGDFRAMPTTSADRAA